MLGTLALAVNFVLYTHLKHLIWRMPAPIPHDVSRALKRARENPAGCFSCCTLLSRGLVAILCTAARLPPLQLGVQVQVLDMQYSPTRMTIRDMAVF